MSTMTIKDEALQAISSLPEDSDFDDIMYRLYVLEKIREGKEAVKDGKVLSTSELKEEMSHW